MKVTCVDCQAELVTASDDTICWTWPDPVQYRCRSCWRSFNQPTMQRAVVRARQRRIERALV